MIISPPPQQVVNRLGTLQVDRHVPPFINELIFPSKTINLLHKLHKPFTFPSTWGLSPSSILPIENQPHERHRGQITHLLEADQEMHLSVFSDFLVRELKD